MFKHWNHIDVCEQFDFNLEHKIDTIVSWCSWTQNFHRKWSNQWNVLFNWKWNCWKKRKKKKESFVRFGKSDKVATIEMTAHMREGKTWADRARFEKWCHPVGFHSLLSKSLSKCMSFFCSVLFYFKLLHCIFLFCFPFFHFASYSFSPYCMQMHIHSLTVCIVRSIFFLFFLSFPLCFRY